LSLGKVKWFDKKKGYGFIEDEQKTEHFVHFSDIMGKGYRVLEAEDEVEFEALEGPKGWQAKNVKVVKKN
jgi:CspA family cold shock protein